MWRTIAPAALNAAHQLVKGRTMTTYSASLSATSANVAASPQQTSAALRPPGNLILAFLPPNEMDRLSSKLQPVELAQGQILYDARMPVDHVYFMDQGMIS